LIREVLSQSLDINMCLNGQWCALHYACVESHIEAARVLLEHGAQPNIVHLMSALHISAIHGDAAILEMLIAHGGNVNMEDHLLSTPLHYAAYHAHAECVQLLLKHGASTVVLNNRGFSPIEVAS
jgi:ankyrin repeat protein